MNIAAFEYDKIPIKDWSISELSKIERLNESLGTQILCMGFEHGNPIVKTTSYVGVIRIGKTSLEIILLLQEYFYSDWSKIKEIIGLEFVNGTEASDVIKNNLDFDADKKIYKIKVIDDNEEFIQAVKKL